jgi:diguanylate cyclase (GGDEF)-like protein
LTAKVSVAGLVATMRVLAFVAGTLLWVLPAPWASAADLAGPASVAPVEQLLDEADRSRLANHPVLARRLDELAARVSEFTPAQSERYQFLRGWQRTYAGDYDGAIALLEPVAEGARDPVVRFRALVTMVNALSIARRYEQAFALQTRVSELLPTVTDPEARAQALGVIAQLHFQVGEYAESRRYAEQLMREQPAGWAACGAAWLLFDAARRQGLPPEPGLDIVAWIARCEAQGSGYFSAALRLIQAWMLVDAGDLASARAVLEAVEPVVDRNAYPRQIADLHATRARLELAAGRPGEARDAALSVIAQRGQGDFSEPQIEAYRILHRVARDAGDTASALDHLESYLTAQSALLDDAKARALAFQMARHRAAEARLEIDSLNRRNEVLALEARLADSRASVARLWIALLVLSTAAAVYFGWRAKRSQLLFRHQAQHDSLTGISNRQQFVRLAETAVRRCEREARPVGLALMDLDHFKMINDLMGHAAGDDALVRAATTTKAVLPQGAVFGRLGGEEFGILLPGAGAAETAEVAERARAALDGASGEDRALRATASYGVATATSAGYDLRNLMIHADAALYQAKHAGRNRVALYDEALAEAVRIARSAGAVPAGSRGAGP